jgi:glucosamine--fructose-6-phosphate aminotransferase (isomerizing)
MCGIIAYLGYIAGIKMSYEGLLVLQNRGYDSAGICSIKKKGFILNKYATNEQINACDKLKESLQDYKRCYNLILHTRWATTGIPSKENSHPHIDFTNTFSVVHNGIIENYYELKEELKKNGVPFKSQTDTEVIVNLIGYQYKNSKNINEAIEYALKRLEGTWGLAIQCIDKPNKLYCARHGSPLLVGFGDNFAMVASEQSGFSRYVDNYICLNNNDLIVLDKIDGKVNFNRIHEYDFRKITVEKCKLSPDPYPHWTLKEINEQYNSSIRAMGRGGRIQNDKQVRLGGLRSHLSDLISIDNLILLGCGTSYHAGLYCLNRLKRISGFNNVQIFDGSEFNKYDIPKRGKTGLILLSQSGETKDLHRCIDVARENNLIMIGVINAVDSMIARDVHCGVYLNAGREVGVASTKSFTSQVIVLNLISIWFAQHRFINEITRMDIIQGLRELPFNIRTIIESAEQQCIKVALNLKDHKSVFILGKGENEAIALEGSLKIKEIGYVNCNGCSTSCLKHGPYALLTKGFPVILLLPDDNMFARNLSVANELKSREAFVIAISDKKNLDNKFDIVINVPRNNYFFGLISNVCLQLIAYHLAVIKGNRVDQPRGLAKVCTVD